MEPRLKTARRWVAVIVTARNKNDRDPCKPAWSWSRKGVLGGGGCVVIEVQEQILVQAAGFEQQRESLRVRPLRVRNSRILVALTFLGSAAAFGLSAWMTLVACSFLLPLHALTFDRLAAAAMMALGAWLMAVSYIFLWRQGWAMAYCSVFLDSFGVHFKLGGTRNSHPIFVPWNGIAAVHYKRVPKGPKFTVLSTDTSTVTFTSNCFYRPKKVAQLIAERAGLPLSRS